MIAVNNASDYFIYYIYVYCVFVNDFRYTSDTITIIYNYHQPIPQILFSKPT